MSAVTNSVLEQLRLCDSPPGVNCNVFSGPSQISLRAVPSAGSGQTLLPHLFKFLQAVHPVPPHPSHLTK
jgi:hypothetical protein